MARSHQWQCVGRGVFCPDRERARRGPSPRSEEDRESMSLLPFDRMTARLEIDRADSDVTLFYSLLFYGEMLTKMLVAGMLASLEDDSDRNRYRLLHRLVRADGV